jgi:hypothetical protein
VRGWGGAEGSDHAYSRALVKHIVKCSHIDVEKF